VFEPNDTRPHPLKDAGGFYFVTQFVEGTQKGAALDAVRETGEKFFEAYKSYVEKKFLKCDKEMH
jgi:hypothetical protein